MPKHIDRDVVLTVKVTVTARQGETNDEVRRWWVNQAYEIPDTENIEVLEVTSA